MRAVLLKDLPLFGLRKGAEGAVITTSGKTCKFKVGSVTYQVDRDDLAVGGLEIAAKLDPKAIHVSDIKSEILPDRESTQTTRPIESINRRPSNVRR